MPCGRICAPMPPIPRSEHFVYRFQGIIAGIKYFFHLVVDCFIVRIRGIFFLNFKEAGDLFKAVVNTCPHACRYGCGYGGCLLHVVRGPKLCLKYIRKYLTHDIPFGSSARQDQRVDRQASSGRQPGSVPGYMPHPQLPHGYSPLLYGAS